MNYDVLTGPELNERIVKASGTSEQVRFAVAFWGKGIADTLKIRAGARIVCNLSSGGTNPYEIQKLMNLGVEVRQHNSLHAKIGCIGSSISFVGSSNMSANGLGDEGSATAGWEESNIVFEGVEPSVEERFEALWSAGREISKSCLEKAEATWRKRQQANQAANADKGVVGSLIEVLKRDPERFEAHNTHVVVYQTVSEEDESIVESGNKVVAQKYGSDFEVYWGWADLPQDAVLLDFRIPTRGQVAFEGIYHWDKTFPDFSDGDECFQVSYKLDRVAGIPVTKKDIKTLRDSVSEYIKSNMPDEDGAFCFPISKLIT